MTPSREAKVIETVETDPQPRDDLNHDTQSQPRQTVSTTTRRILKTNKNNRYQRTDGDRTRVMQDSRDGFEGLVLIGELQNQGAIHKDD